MQGNHCCCCETDGITFRMVAWLKQAGKCPSISEWKRISGFDAER
jgi:hypothetical protein